MGLSTGRPHAKCRLRRFGVLLIPESPSAGRPEPCPSFWLLLHIPDLKLHPGSNLGGMLHCIGNTPGTGSDALWRPRCSLERAGDPMRIGRSSDTVHAQRCSRGPSVTPLVSRQHIAGLKRRRELQTPDQVMGIAPRPPRQRALPRPPNNTVSRFALGSVPALAAIALALALAALRLEPPLLGAPGGPRALP